MTSAASPVAEGHLRSAQPGAHLRRGHLIGREIGEIALERR
jgi:hypothetical protein